MSNEFIEVALEVIENDRQLGQRRDGAAPVVDLMRGYNEMISALGSDQHLPVITDESTGRDLKNAICKLEVKHQMVLLLEFNENMKRATGPYGYESLKERDERTLRHRIIYACVVAFLVILVSGAIGGVVALGVLSGEFKNPIATTYFDSTLEIFKVIFSIEDKP
jgi:hypothetical protein